MPYADGTWGEKAKLRNKKRLAYFREYAKTHPRPKKRTKKGWNPNSIGRRFVKGTGLGSDNPAWRGGIHPVNLTIRAMPEFLEWRLSVFERDGYKCRDCGNGGYLHAHHITPFYQILVKNNLMSVVDARKCDELWFAFNGITLCRNCHLQRHGLVKKESDF